MLSILKKICWPMLICLVLAACTSPTAVPTVQDTLEPTLPSPQVGITRAPDPRETAATFLTAWQTADYPAMYAMTTAISQDAITSEDFAARYQSAKTAMTLASLDYELLGALTNPASAQVNYRVTYHTGLLGDLKSQMVMNLSLENSEWKVQWEDALIHNELKGGHHFALDVTVPARGNIYDKDMHALASFADAVALGVVPGDINPDTEGTLLRELSELTGKSGEEIKASYEFAAPDWYIPVGEASADAVQQRYSVLSSLTPGLRMNAFRSRYYDGGGIAPHTLGYLLSISPEEVDEYTSKGYLVDEKVGKAGLEKWGETALRGSPKASLYVVNAQGQTVTRLAEVEAKPAQSLVTTLDKDLQSKIQRSFGSYNGAVIVMERDTGRILAMASNPGYDANLFEPTNYNNYGTSQLLDLYNDPNRPLLNRATQGTYPLGSVFKIITLSAALESGIFTPESEYQCGYVWNELGYPLYDWTYEKGYAASGLLTLPQGLIRSCDPWFYHIGLTIFRNPDHFNAVAEMSRAFGLGSATGIGQVAEVEGSIPDPETEDDSVQLAFGQGAMLVTPLQVVNFIAAVGNGGTLHRPQIIEEIAPVDGEPSYTFKPEVTGTLPVSPENLKVVQDAMRGVIASTKPLGTAHFVLANLSIPVAGKTGTAQNSTGESHAWFAGYTFANRTNKPDIAVVVLLENAGEGSELAAPFFRRVVQLYFSNNSNPGLILPWESTYYVQKTPTPEPVVETATEAVPTETPAP